MPPLRRIVVEDVRRIFELSLCLSEQFQLRETKSHPVNLETEKSRNYFQLTENNFFHHGNGLKGKQWSDLIRPSF